jgi:hypothetical protein
MKKKENYQIWQMNYRKLNIESIDDFFKQDGDGKNNQHRADMVSLYNETISEFDGCEFGVDIMYNERFMTDESIEMLNNQINKARLNPIKTKEKTIAELAEEL